MLIDRNIWGTFHPLDGPFANLEGVYTVHALSKNPGTYDWNIAKATYILRTTNHIPDIYIIPN